MLLASMYVEYYNRDMPKLGEIRSYREIGYRSSYRYIWAACEGCGKQRWVRFVNGAPMISRCRKCGIWQNRIPKEEASARFRKNWEKRPDWKQGRIINPSGYILVKLYPGDFFFPMAGPRGYIQEHRLMMARHLGRCLHSWETIHHKDGNKSNNDISNLELSSRGSHSLSHHNGYKDGYTKGLQDGHNVQIQKLKQKITELEKTLENLKFT